MTSKNHKFLNSYPLQMCGMDGLSHSQSGRP